MKQTLSVMGLTMLLVLLAACGPSPEEIATMTASAWTPTLPPPTQTPIPPTPTPIPIDLTVTVVDETGAPISGASISFPESGDDTAVQTDGQGQYSWSNLAGEAATLTISAQGYMPNSANQTLVRGINEVSIVLQRDPLGLLPSEACAVGEKLLYAEDFQDGKAQGWPEIEVAAPGWKVLPDADLAGNTLLTATMGAPWTFYNREQVDLNNAVWRLRYKYTGESFTHFNFRFIENPQLSARYMYVAGVYSNLQRMQNTPGVGLGNFPSLKADEWHFIEIGFFNGTFTIWLDGKEVITYQDPQPWESGTVNLEPYPQTDVDVVYFDNLAVCELSAPFTSIVPAAP